MPNPRKGERPAAVEFGARMRAKRVELGITQPELGQMLNRTYQQICKYESGANRFPITLLAKLCDVLNVEVAYFVDAESPVSDDITSNCGVLAVVKHYRALPPWQREAVSALMVRLARGE